jgi:predicted cobalt transporter CbtA
MVGALLLRGMLVGLVAGILGFGFLKIVGEPPVERSIVFENQSETKATDEKAEAEPVLVSRKVQAGIGLFTGVMVYSAAFGGLFALAFALAYRRLGDLSPRATAALLATAGFVAVYLVPTLKYPANPPAVGAPDTIGLRTSLYFTMIALSLAGIIAAGMLRDRLRRRFGEWNAAVIAGVAYLAAMIIVGLALPTVNEVPENFPAIVLWQFRIASIGGQLILWATVGLAFGAAAEPVVGERSGSPLPSRI